MKRYVRTLSLVGVSLLLLLLSACKGPGGGKETTTPGGSTEHTHQYIEEVFPPTCSAEGYTMHLCLTCDDYYTDTPTEKLPHTYADVVVAATCTAEGYTEHICSVCGDHYTDTPTEKLPHVWGAAVIPPTCTAEGYTKHTCYLCQESYNDTPTAPIGHHYLSEIIRPTGTEQGYTLHTCIQCNDSYKDTYTDPFARTVTAYFDANGGIMPEEPRVIYPYQTGEQVTLPIPVMEGFRFDGWYLSMDEGETLVSNGPWKYAEDIRLTARWAPIEVKYEILLGEGGASLGYANNTIKWGHAVGKLPEATPLFGYLFDGYYESNTPITPQTISRYTKNIVLEARFLPPLQTGHVSGGDSHADYDWALYADGILRFRIEQSENEKKNTITIATGAFRGMKGLVGAELPRELSDIGQFAFADCPDLKNISVPGSAGVLRASVFEGCSALESVTLGSGISIINEDAFKNCSSLSTLTLPQSLFQIYSPFEGCTSLGEIHYAGSSFQWSVIVKDPAAAAALEAEGVQYFFEENEIFG